jgi:hypothetical protein
VKEITHWRAVLEVPNSFPFQEHLNVLSWSSHTQFFEQPAWVLSLYEKSNDGGNGNGPNAPFFNAEVPLFAASLTDLTEHWLRFDRRERNTGSQEYLLVLPDSRGWFTAFHRDDEQVHVTVSHNGDHKVFCAYSGDSARGKKSRAVKPISGLSAVFDFPSDLNSIEFFLLTDDGEVLDTFRENAYGHNWGESVLRQHRTSLPSGHLQEALLSGEMDTVEFKSGIDCAPRDTKSLELIQTATAFANTSGGAIYIGISDNAEPKGIAVPLKKRYAAPAQGEIEKMKELYVRDLRKLLDEGITPVVNYEFEWLEIALQPILEIRVSRSENVVHSVVENGQIYLRAGATNRKVRGDDMLDLMARRRSAESNLTQMVYRSRQGGIY